MPKVTGRPTPRCAAPPKPRECKACGGTRHNSRGGLCAPCVANGRVTAEDVKRA